MHKFRDLINSNRFFIAIFTLLLLFRIWLFPIYIVDGASMEPTLSDGQRIIGTNYSQLDRFDLVIAKDANLDKIYVKRIIALPNERIEYRDNSLYIDGDFIEEVFLDEMAVTRNLSQVLGSDEYYLIGDNRNNSVDSRGLGPFKEEQIISELKFRYWPLGDLSWLE